MLRLPLAPARALIAGLVLLILAIAVPGSALAQTAPKQPVIDSAPSRIGYRNDARISGHLEGFTPGDEVALQRKDQYAWNDVKIKPVDNAGEVRFTLVDKVTTDTYRLAYTGPAGETSTSDEVTIKVRPRLTLSLSRSDVMVGGTVKLTGVLEPPREGRQVKLQQRVDGDWKEIATVAAGDGTFAYSFTPQRSGARGLRVLFWADGQNAGNVATRVLSVYRQAEATWYGPGFYGERTACGKRLTKDTLGVAHRTLPCGTNVDILYRGRTVSVTVIDRGPYTDEDFDLTSRTAERLRFSGSGWIGVVTGN
ncbi:MAG: septal ring lytic transglycosylase RlpA family protein [Gaiellales bacterium]